MVGWLAANIEVLQRNVSTGSKVTGTCQVPVTWLLTSWNCYRE